ncbi:glycoside hydrolase/deacetylase [Rhizoclosmatium globosum]|uniref:Glycoside hydrolase/deacetylase n=1 Tax=Rhizoclosmatium globosum TaxID=329046 RepID=A0A1Y2C5A9_9FUNG|nr:glycoside hydrolase/deacetylase [Rhizoclosmatium globosum]|eukprot:ORY42230.1 glycoside hydrolase/deacetylase [Rhizoclosmatium globosum]
MNTNLCRTSNSFSTEIPTAKTSTTSFSLAPTAAPALFKNNFSWAPAPFSAAPGAPIWTQYFSQFAPSLPIQDITVCTGPTSNAWGATFDDGPSENTHVALEYFQTVGMQATFWVIGSNILNFPDVVANTFQSGHQIGSHTWSHPDLVTLSDDQVIAELVYGCKAIQEVTGVYPKYFRPPYGSIDDRVRSLAASMGLQSVTWAVDTQDWSYVGTGNMYLVPQAFKSWLNQGVILPISLEHDLFPETVAVVQQSMDLLINSGRIIKTVAECIGDSDPYGNGVLQSFFSSGLFESK